jgi:hypothetical protein
MHISQLFLGSNFFQIKHYLVVFRYIFYLNSSDADIAFFKGKLREAKFLLRGGHVSDKPGTYRYNCGHFFMHESSQLKLVHIMWQIFLMHVCKFGCFYLYRNGVCYGQHALYYR